MFSKKNTILCCLHLICEQRFFHQPTLRIFRMVAHQLTIYIERDNSPKRQPDPQNENLLKKNTWK